MHRSFKMNQALGNNFFHINHSCCCFFARIIDHFLKLKDENLQVNNLVVCNFPQFLTARFIVVLYKMKLSSQQILQSWEQARQFCYRRTKLTSSTVLCRIERRKTKSHSEMGYLFHFWWSWSLSSFYHFQNCYSGYVPCSSLWWQKSVFFSESDSVSAVLCQNILFLESMVWYVRL